MWTLRLRFSRLALLLFAAIGVLVAWLLLNHLVFAFLACAIAFFVFMLAIAWDGWRQTSPSNLAALGLRPGDRELRMMDPGLRRDYQPMVPAVVRWGVSTTRNRLRGGPPAPGMAPRGRPPATRSAIPTRAAPTKSARTTSAAAKGTRSGRTRPRGEDLPLNATVTLAEERRAAGVDDLFAALDRELVGLAPVKKKVAEIGSLLLVDRARQRFGLSAVRPNLHMCFTGSPGTGKTTVALMMADLLHRLGYLETGQLVHAMRDDLVGEYIGQTAPKTKYILDRAMGGVLFIDEAYSLYRATDSKDYGQEAIDILMQIMENERSRVVVILAGYKDRMDHFFESNPGMRSRIAHHLDFAPYQTDELLAIGQRMLGQSSYYLSAEATVAFRDYLSRQSTLPRFAGGRSVRNALEGARLRHAHRLTSDPGRSWSKDDLMRLEPPDILPHSDLT